MTNQQLQQDPQPGGADRPDWADIEKVLGRYEKFVRDKKIDRAYRVGTTAFFLLCNGALFMTYALMAIQQTDENPLSAILPELSFLGVAACFVWWALVRGSYFLWDENKGPETHARRDLLREAIRLHLYWLLDKIPLQDETPPKGIATAVPLTFLAIHILLGVFLAAIAA
ncbi:MAG: hypothetical protein F4Z95_01365 [Gammaproteobacteria bacterium]|nr:hypothetical protein [Gammaproteobacteria bacterium]